MTDPDQETIQMAREDKAYALGVFAGLNAANVGEVDRHLFGTIPRSLPAYVLTQKQIMEAAILQYEAAQAVLSAARKHR